MRFLSCIGFAIIGFVLSGCGRGYTIKGRVVTLEGVALSDSLVAQVTGQSMPQEGVPVPNARIGFFHDLDREGRPVRATVWQRSFSTNKDGYFEFFDFGPPFDGLVGLEVSADGYKTAYAAYWDQSEINETFYVILVRDR